jgi:gluconokinase
MTLTEKTECLLALDIGTTHIKALAFDVSLNVLDEEIEVIPTTSPQNLFQHQDPETLRIGCESVLKKLIERGSKNSIKAIVFSNAMHSLIPVDLEGDPLYDAIIWSDLRAGKIASEIKDSETGRQLYIETGTPIHPMSPLFKILWIKENEPEIFSKTFKFLSIKDYIIYHWFGLFKTDYSTASASGLFSINKREWSPQALDLAGISNEHLPQATDIYHEFQVGNSGFFQSLDISTDTPIIIGATDGCLAAIGGGKIMQGELSLTIGTSAAIRAVRKQPLVDKEGRVFNYYLDENTYVTGGPSNNGGNLLDWYGNNFIQGFDRVSSSAQWAELINSTNPGSDGLTFLPYIFAERAPLWDASVTGSFHGIKHSHNSNHFARAVLEGMILNLKVITQILEDSNINRLIVSGGAFNIPNLGQLVADVFGIKVSILKTTNLSARGAAIVGWKYLNQTVNVPQKTDLEFLPNQEHSKAYSTHFSKFKELLKNHLTKHNL